MLTWGQFWMAMLLGCAFYAGAFLLVRFGQGTLSDDMDRWAAEAEAKVAEIAALVEGVRTKLQ